MSFQKTINQFLAAGVAGEYADDSPRREAGYILLAQRDALNDDAITALPKFACAFTHTENDGEAVVGGTGEFAGILVNPKAYVNHANLNASLELPDGSQGGLCTMGHVFVKSATAFAPGYVAAYANATGVISAYASADSIPETSTQIPAKFIQVSGSANGLGILEIGAFVVPVAATPST